MAYTIHTLRLGEICLPGAHEGGDWGPVCGWLLGNGSGWTMVDTGMPDAGYIAAKWNVEARGGGADAVRAALASHGIGPQDVGRVVLTHLHFDHAWNLDLFPHAQVLVQREELAHARDPVPSQRPYYTRRVLDGLLERSGRLELLDGDTVLDDGLTLMKAPGHTPGLQVACVTTARGRVGLVSDLGEEYGCWFPADPVVTPHPRRYLADTFRTPSIRSESELECLRSMRRVADAVDIVVPAHDVRIPRVIPEEWFARPDRPPP